MTRICDDCCEEVRVPARQPWSCPWCGRINDRNDEEPTE